MALNRRTFLQTLALSGVAPGMLNGQQGKPGRERIAWQKAPCCFCDVGCGLLIGIQDGRAVAVKGDIDSPVSKGMACAKGYYAVQALYGADRITRALVRKNGSLVAVPLAEAYDVIARNLREVQRKHDRDAVALYGSGQWSITDAYVGRRLFRDGLGSTNIDTDARLYGASAWAGALTSFGVAGPTASFDDIDRADTIVLWNHNIAEMDPVLFSRILERRRTNRVRVVEVATRTTRTSYGIDRSILYAPQSEIIVANAICEQIVARHAHDDDFLAKHVVFKSDGGRDTNWSAYRDFLEEYSPRKTRPISGVAPDDITWLASLYADRARNVVSIWGPEVGQHVQGTAVNNAIINVHLVTGKLATPGNGVVTLCGQPNGATVHDAGAPGTHALSIFQGVERGDIRFLWIQATNPMVSLPNVQRYRRALAAPDRFIVVSDAYPTATTEFADVILPAALWIEREGIYGNAEGRLQRFRQLTDPPGDACADAWHMIEVARRLGLGKLFPWTEANHFAQSWQEYERSHPAPATTALGRNPWSIWLRPYRAPIESPDPAYPFWLTVGSVLEHAGTGTLTRRVPTLHRAVPRAYVELHANDAAELRIRNGDRVRLTSRRGAIELRARINVRSQPSRGTVFVPDFDADAPIKVLTLDAHCPVSGQPAYQTSAVRVERV